jgi:hypothetical protein
MELADLIRITSSGAPGYVEVLEAVSVREEDTERRLRTNRDRAMLDYSVGRTWVT